ncbi:MAG TPA: outer membrane protein transport protein [Thermoanaerobaculia bacterium]|nr:outer membrane protein transport protein [Thermoanaerobaculia bacterium]
MRHARLIVVIIVLSIGSTAAYGTGFQVHAQGARAMGMGLAFTAVSDDASGVYYNPAGLVWEKTRFDVVAGAMLARNIDATFRGAAPFPGAGVTEEERKGNNVLPELYGRFGSGRTRFAIGAYTPFGLPITWDNPNTFTGRFVSQRSLLRTVNINPTVAFRVSNSLSIGVGADYMYSKLGLERSTLGPAGTPLAGREIAHLKLSTKQFDSHGWGWNAGLQWRPAPEGISFGVAYRSGISIDHKGTATFTQILTGIPPIDAAVAANPLIGEHAASAKIRYPSTLNAGLAYSFGTYAQIAVEADQTRWKSFDELAIVIPGVSSTPIPTAWHNSWAYRVGGEIQCGPLVCRAGYYRDQTPQPVADIGPILPDADRRGYSLGIGIQRGRLGIDIGDVYIRFKDRSTAAANTYSYFGSYHTTANEFAVNVHWR